MKKGASSLVIVFIILVVSLIAVTWFRSNITSGTSTQEQLVGESSVETFSHRFENAKLYLENSLMYAGEKGSDLAANYSGRSSRNPNARYWMCGMDNLQLPDRKTAREAISNFTKPALEGRIDEVHGIRNNLIYEVGGMACVESGFNTPLNRQSNDEFRQGVRIKSINLTREDGSLKTSQDNLTISKEIKYNRYWYIYAVMKKWLTEENLKDDIKDKLSKVKDSSKVPNPQCVSDPSQCTYKEPDMCSDHPEEFAEATINGFSEELDKLNSNSKYFNGSGVQCSLEQNTKNGARYPGVRIQPADENFPSNTSTHNNCMTDDHCLEWNDSDPDQCLRREWRFRCVKKWTLVPTSTIDFTVNCRDTKFRSIPNRSLRNLNWKIDLSYKVTDTTEDGSYSCDTPIESKAPLSSKCSPYTAQTPNICQTEVDTTN